MQKRVLIVGENHARENDSHGLRFAFERVATGLEALERLNQGAFVAVVVDSRLPGGLSGSSLLDEVMRRQPAALRFLRANLHEQAAVLQCLGLVHRFLGQPADSQTIQHAVECALAMECWLPSESVRRHLSRLRNVPSPPQLYYEMVRLLQSPEVSLDQIGETIARDPAMTAKLLQLVNSAVFGLRLRVSHPGEAIGYIGLEATKALVLLAHTFSHFAELVSPVFSIEKLWHHSFQTARTAQWIAEFESKDSATAAETFTAGLLHDFGKLVLAANLPEEFQQAVQRAADEELEIWQAELDAFGSHHGEIGACLLSIWGLPSAIIEAVGLHHRPARLSSAEFTPLAAVHVANVFARTADLEHPQPALPQLDMEYLQAAGWGDRVADWTQVISEMNAPAHYTA